MAATAAVDSPGGYCSAGLSAAAATEVSILNTSLLLVTCLRVRGPGFNSTSPARSSSSRRKYRRLLSYFCLRLLGVGRGSRTINCAGTFRLHQHHGVYCTVSSTLIKAQTAAAPSSAYMLTFPPNILQYLPKENFFKGGRQLCRNIIRYA